MYNSAELSKVDDRALLVSKPGQQIECPWGLCGERRAEHGNVCYSPGWEHVTLKCRVPGGFSLSLGLDGRRHGKTSLLALPSSVLLTETDCFATYNFETLNHCVFGVEMHFIVRLEML